MTWYGMMESMVGVVRRILIPKPDSSYTEGEGVRTEAEEEVEV